ncbi:hypothetical protein LXA43DRAFT_1021420 [Ganoderma leucocontextum]|nr:hypothetical protein LXA43DRAFT_1021420 [Ganoderma leucocontextum]
MVKYRLHLSQGRKPFGGKRGHMGFPYAQQARKPSPTQESQLAEPTKTRKNAPHLQRLRRVLMVLRYLLTFPHRRNVAIFTARPALALMRPRFSLSRGKTTPSFSYLASWPGRADRCRVARAPCAVRLVSIPDLFSVRNQIRYLRLCIGEFRPTSLKSIPWSTGVWAAELGRLGTRRAPAKHARACDGRTSPALSHIAVVMIVKRVTEMAK